MVDGSVSPDGRENTEGKTKDEGEEDGGSRQLDRRRQEQARSFVTARRVLIEVPISPRARFPTKVRY